MSSGALCRSARPGLALPPRGLGPLGGRLGVLQDQRLQARLDGDRDPLGVLRLALDRVDHSIADPAHPGLQRLEQLAGADELLPARQHLATQQGPVGRRLGDRGDGAVVGRVGVRAQLRGSLDLVADRVRDGVRPAARGADRALERLLDHRASGLRVGGQRRQPGPDLGHVVGRQQALVVELALGDDEQRGVLEAPAGQHPREVGRHRLGGLLGGAVEHDRDRRGPLRGLLEEAPRHLVGVARGGGDEQPEVGGGQQLGGELAVALLDGVDVGRVQDGQPGRQRIARHQLQRVGVVGGVVDALEVGQQPVLAEPAQRPRGGARGPVTGSWVAARRGR